MAIHRSLRWRLVVLVGLLSPIGCDEPDEGDGEAAGESESIGEGTGDGTGDGDGTGTPSPCIEVAEDPNRTCDDYCATQGQVCASACFPFAGTLFETAGFPTLENCEEGSSVTLGSFTCGEPLGSLIPFPTHVRCCCE